MIYYSEEDFVKKPFSSGSVNKRKYKQNLHLVAKLYDFKNLQACMTRNKTIKYTTK